jgi:hypothetical protein
MMLRTARIVGTFGCFLFAVTLAAGEPGEKGGKGEGPRGGRGGRGGGEAGQRSGPEPVAKDDAEKKILDVLEEVRGQGDRGEARRRDRHLERLLGPVVLPGPPDDRREADHVR